MGEPRKLRSMLVRSHLVVMVVAVGTLVVGVVIIGGVLAAFDLVDLRSGKGGPDEGGPLPLLAVVGSAVLAASVVARRVSTRLAAPLEAMGAATRRIADGDYTVRVVDDSSAETAQLAADVNALAENLEVTERRRLELIGEVAHELRTPLTSIEGSMEALMDGVLEPSEEVFAGIAREAARLRRVAGDLSELSRTAERLTLELAPTDVAAVARDVVDRLGVQADAKDLTLTFSALDADRPVIDADRDRLVQVFTNVIGNAIRYTDEGSITVTVASDVDDVRIEVVDTGRGVPADRIEQIFERFVRVDHTQADGTGVGLTIARSLVEAHGGVISARSAGADQGTSVLVVLPRRPGRPRPTGAVPQGGVV